MGFGDRRLLYSTSRVAMIVDHLLDGDMRPFRVRVGSRRFPVAVIAHESRFVPGPRYTGQIGLPFTLSAPGRKPNYAWLRFSSSVFEFMTADEAEQQAGLAISASTEGMIRDAQAYFYSNLWC